MNFLSTLLRRFLSRSEPKMLKSGDTAPAFELAAHNGETVRSRDLAGKRWVLWFYPKADTPG